MKKLIVGIALIVLLVGILAACSQNEEYKEEGPHENGDSVTSDVADFLTLDAEFRALRDEPERTVTVEEIFDLQAVNGAVLHTSQLIVMVDGMDEYMDVQRTHDGSGRLVSETEIILTDGVAYVDIETIMALIMPMMFEEIAAYAESLGVTYIVFDDISSTDILDGHYTHMQLSADTLAEIIEEIQAGRAGINGIFTEETLGNYLSRNDAGVFRIEITGEAVNSYIEAVLEEVGLGDISLMFGKLILIADIDDALPPELERNFAGWVRDSDLTDAQIVIERWKSDDNTYHQNVELYIPERVAIDWESTVVVGESTAITPPTLSLTEEELDRRIEDVAEWMLAVLVGTAPDETAPDTNTMSSNEEREQILQDHFSSPTLVGTWAWDQYDAFIMEFFADGTGRRNWGDGWIQVTWNTGSPAPDNLVIHPEGFRSEWWTFTIAGDVLTIVSSEYTWTYIRIA